MTKMWQPPLDELTIEANEESFVVVLQHGGNDVTCKGSVVRDVFSELDELAESPEVTIFLTESVYQARSSHPSDFHPGCELRINKQVFVQTIILGHCI